MARRFPCPECTKEMLLERIHEGFEVPCPACGHRFLVPPGAGSGTAASLPPVRHPDPQPVLRDDGTISMIVGIVAFAASMFCPVFVVLGPVAWYLGHRARSEARSAGVEAPGPATAGFVLGIVATGLLALGLAGFVLFVAFAAAGNF